MKTIRFLAAGLIILGLGASAFAQSYHRRELRIPAGGVELEAVVVRLDEPGRRPLALINHGSPRDAAARADMTPLGMLPQAMEFARRGWIAAIVLRRGYGGSGGGWAETYGRCSSPDYGRAGAEAAADLRAAIVHLAALPDVDGERVLSVGVSAGGFATVALTADPPPGLRAAVNFAGGRGSLSNDNVCRAELLTETFRAYGARSRTPMLWVYAVNDRYFGPAVATALKDAFVGAGGNAAFVQTQAFREDGHQLFTGDGISIWAPLVDDFLEKQNLKLRPALANLPSLPRVAPPAELSANGRAAFEEYLRAPPHKAFAVSSRGNFGYRSGRRTEENARDAALAACASGGAGDCRLRMVGDVPVK
jgi:dienelactone hydrolase